MVDIRPSQLTPAPSASATGAIIIDDGVQVQRATPAQVVDAAAPVATQADASSATDNVKRMTPLRVAQFIEAQLSGASLPTAIGAKARATALGVSGSAGDMGTYASPLVADGQTVKQNIADLASATETAQAAIDGMAWAEIYAAPSVVFGMTDQSANIEGGAPKVMLTRSNDLAFLQVSVTARDKTNPPAIDLDALRITGLPFSANGIQPQGLWLEPDTGLPPDTYAALVGDTIGFYLPGRVPVTADMVADNYYLRVSGIVAILPSETFE
jgi:hypothetical protein